ncbi:2-nitropropane dioxygenase, partial [Virgibacillus profundi]
AGDGEAVSCWAGQTYPLAGTGPAAGIVGRLRAEAVTALDRAAARFG